MKQMSNMLDKEFKDTGLEKRIELSETFSKEIENI